MTPCTGSSNFVFLVEAEYQTSGLHSRMRPSQRRINGLINWRRTGLRLSRNCRMTLRLRTVLSNLSGQKWWTLHSSGLFKMRNEDTYLKSQVGTLPRHVFWQAAIYLGQEGSSKERPTELSSRIPCCLVELCKILMAPGFRTASILETSS